MASRFSIGNGQEDDPLTDTEIFLLLVDLLKLVPRASKIARFAARAVLLRRIKASGADVWADEIQGGVLEEDGGEVEGGKEKGRREEEVWREEGWDEEDDEFIIWLLVTAIASPVRRLQVS